ncbi:MAG: hypothetical protein PVI57_06805 [Gemmatimonadota bacterium]|jgi:hypothetical protein
MTDTGARRGAANFAPVLMILSFLLMAGFLAWLGLTSEGTEEVAMQEGDDTVAEQADSMEMAAVPVTPDELRLNAANYEGQSVRIDAPVAGAVGSQAFFLDLPQSPFLVKMDSALVAEGRRMPVGDVVVTGTVLAMTDSIVGAWSNAGTISEADRPLVEFATHFIQASRIRGGQPPAGGGEGGQDADGGGPDGD